MWAVERVLNVESVTVTRCCEGEYSFRWVWVLASVLGEMKMFGDARWRSFSALVPSPRHQWLSLGGMVKPPTRNFLQSWASQARYAFCGICPLTRWICFWNVTRCLGTRIETLSILPDTDSIYTICHRGTKALCFHEGLQWCLWCLELTRHCCGLLCFSRIQWSGLIFCKHVQLFSKTKLIKFKKFK